MNSKFILHSFLIFLLSVFIANVSCLVRVDWDTNQKNIKKSPSPDAFPRVEDANLTQYERDRLTQDSKKSGLPFGGMEIIQEKESSISFEKACIQLLSKCQANCMEEWYPFSSIFLPFIAYKTAKQLQCMDRCNQFCNMPMPSRILSGETRTNPAFPVPQSQ
ncbi:hypothetical protein AB3N59_03305 [Leptospira sp. WS92.C1]